MLFLLKYQVYDFAEIIKNKNLDFVIPEQWKAFDCVFCYNVSYHQIDEVDSELSYNIIDSYNLGLLDTKSEIYSEVIIKRNVGEPRLSLHDLLSICIEFLKDSSNIKYKSSNRLHFLQICRKGDIEWSALSDRNCIDLRITQGMPYYKYTSLNGFISTFKVNNYIKIPWSRGHSINVSLTNVNVAGHLAESFKKKDIDVSSLHIKSDVLKILSNDSNNNTIKILNELRSLLLYEVNFLDICKIVVCEEFFPFTLAKLAEMYFSKKLKEYYHINYHPDDNSNKELIKGFKQLLGYKPKQKKDNNGRYYTRYIPIVDDLAHLIISKSYKGGMSVGYLNGVYHCNEDEIIVDIDLSSAYPIALCLFNDLDCGKLKRPSDNDYYNVNIWISNIQDMPYYELFTNDSMPIFFAYIDFKWDDDTKFPTLPVSDDSLDGVFFTKNGSTYCSSIEIASALMTGKVKIKIKDYVYIPQNETKHIIRDITKDLIEQRFCNLDNKLLNSVYKTIINTAYGKIAQGISEKSNNLQLQENAKNSSGGKTKSIISSHILAALITSVACVILNEMTQIFTAHNCKVINALVDGIMVTIPLADKTVLDNVKPDDVGLNADKLISPDIMQELESSLITKYLVNFYKTLNANGKGWLTVKHIGDTVDYYKTKAFCLMYQDKPSYLVAAGTHFNSVEEFKSVYENDILVPRTISKKATVLDVKQNRYKDIIKYEAKETLSTSPDIKRIYDDNYDSMPYNAIDDIVDAKRRIDERKKRGKKTTVNSLNTHINSKGNNKCKLRNVSNSDNDMCQRMMLRAIAKRESPFDELLRGQTNAAIARKLGKKDLKNENRAEFTPSIIPDLTVNRNEIERICSILGIPASEKIFNLILKRQ